MDKAKTVPKKKFTLQEIGTDLNAIKLRSELGAQERIKTVVFIGLALLGIYVSNEFAHNKTQKLINEHLCKAPSTHKALQDKDISDY